LRKGRLRDIRSDGESVCDVHHIISAAFGNYRSDVITFILSVPDFSYLVPIPKYEGEAPMVQMMIEHFSTQAARIIYMQKSDYVDSMVKAGVIKENQAEHELARLLERSLLELGLEVPEVVRSRM